MIEMNHILETALGIVLGVCILIILGELQEIIVEFFKMINWRGIKRSFVSAIKRAKERIKCGRDLLFESKDLYGMAEAIDDVAMRQTVLDALDKYKSRILGILENENNEKKESKK